MHSISVKTYAYNIRRTMQYQAERSVWYEQPALESVRVAGYRHGTVNFYLHCVREDKLTITTETKEDVPEQTHHHHHHHYIIIIIIVVIKQLLIRHLSLTVTDTIQH